MRRVTVALSPPYDVLVAPGALARLGDALGEHRRVAVVSQAAVADVHAPVALEGLRTDGRDAEAFTIGDGEEAKTLATVEGLCRELTLWGLRRGDAIVALGGGVVGDTAGLAAALYHRGVALVHAPTTLLAMVDAAIGGKTAVNLPEGKNLVGAFHQPLAVVADIDTLASLSSADFRSGLGEVAKYALLPEGGAVASLLDERAADVLARDPAVLTDLVAACAQVKATIVASDPEERTGARATLNYGHTLAHALETTGRYSLTHGEAVAVGLVFAVSLALSLERVDGDAVARVRTLLEEL
ncbi:MAG TPA: 3-dehydroquinate synthase family protein, partial [Acidimicrobiia bacterium]|nr:3-dehydroquinate synthase family protein [Acidimicrobiia bacterium]